MDSGGVKLSQPEGFVTNPDDQKAKALNVAVKTNGNGHALKVELTPEKSSVVNKEEQFMEEAIIINLEAKIVQGQEYANKADEKLCSAQSKLNETKKKLEMAELKEKSEIDSVKEDLNASKSKISALEQSLAKANEKAENISFQFETVTKKASSLEKIAADSEKKAMESENKLALQVEILQTEMKKMESSLREEKSSLEMELEKSRKNVSDLEGNLKVYMQKLEKEMKLKEDLAEKSITQVSELQNSLSAKDLRMKELVESLESMKIEIEKLQMLLKAGDEKEGLYKENSVQYEKLKQEYEISIGKVVELESKLKLSEASVLGNDKGFNSLKNEAAVLSAKVEELQEKLKATEEKLKCSEMVVESLKDEQKRLKIDVEGLKEAEVRLMKSEKDLQEKLNTSAEKVSELEKSLESSKGKIMEMEIGLERSEKVRIELEVKLKKTEAKCSEHESNANKSLGRGIDLEAQLKAAETKTLKLEETIKALSKENSDLKVSIKGVQTQAEDSLTKHNEEMAIMKQKQIELEKKVKDSEERAHKEEIKATESELLMQKAKEEIAGLVKEVEGLRKGKKELEEKVRISQEAKPSNSVDRSIELEGLIEKYQTQTNEATRRIAELEAALQKEKLETSLKSKDVAVQMDELKKLVKAYEDQIREKQAAIADQERLLTESKQKESELEKRAIAAEANLQKQMGITNDLQQNISALKEFVAESKNGVHSLKVNAEEMKISLLESLQRETILKNSLSESEVKLSQLKANLQQESAKFSELEGLVTKANLQAKDAVLKLAEAETELAKLRPLTEKAAKADTLLHELSVQQNLVNDLKASLTQIQSEKQECSNEVTEAVNKFKKLEEQLMNEKHNLELQLLGLVKENGALLEKDAGLREKLQQALGELKATKDEIVRLSNQINLSTELDNITKVQLEQAGNNSTERLKKEETERTNEGKNAAEIKSRDLDMKHSDDFSIMRRKGEGGLESVSEERKLNADHQSKFNSNPNPMKLMLFSLVAVSLLSILIGFWLAQIAGPV